jgi:uncharacterized repeat protein (TIGR01451 family)
VRPTRRYLAIALMGAGLLGAYWAVSAQEGGPLGAPPAVFPTDTAAPVSKGVDSKALGKFPKRTNPPRNTTKADPTLIVPAEAYDVPRPVQSEPKPRTSDLLRVQGAAPPPVFPPPAPKPKQAQQAIAPPPLPAIDTNPLPVPMPMPIVDPTKALIVEPATKEPRPKKSAVPELQFPPPAVLFPAPALTPEAKKDPAAPAPSLVLPPPSVIPETTQAPRAPTATVQAEKPKGFVRIESAARSVPPVLAEPGPIPPDPVRAQDQVQKPVAPPPVLAPHNNALAHLQTPSVTLEKRGPSSLRRGQQQPYEIVIRNLGPAPAQQVHVEDELPANVRIHVANPMPQLQGNKAVWVLPVLPVNGEQVLSLLLEASADAEMKNRTSVYVAATSQTTATAPRPRSDTAPMMIQLAGPNLIALGQPAVFEIRVANQSAQPLTGIVLHGMLPEGLNTPQGRAIEGQVDSTIAPGESKTLKMPASAVKPGRYTVAVKVTTQTGHEASATAVIDIVAETLHLQQAPAARLFVGRDGDLRVDVTNYTSKALRNVAVADRLPDGLDFVAASERGLYQANSRTVYWLIDQMPPGKTRTLVVRVNGVKAGQQQNVVFAKADGVAEMQSAGVVALEGIADLSLRVTDRDNPLELGKETVYEIWVRNPGNAPAGNVQLQVQFPPGLMPKNAEGKTKFSMDRRTVLFEPIRSLPPHGQATYRVSALAKSIGDQRVRFAIASDQVRVPIQREISTIVYSDKMP